MAYVEVLVIVGVVLTLGLAAVLALGNGSKSAATHQAQCIESMACNGTGTPGNAGLAATVGNPGSAGTPGSAGEAETSSGGTWQNIKDFGYGFGSEAVGLVTGTWQAVTHPIQTVEGLAFVVSHPVMTWNAISNEWSQRSTAENLGRGLLEVLTIVGPGAVTKIAKGAEIAADVGRVAHTAEEAAVAQRAAAEAAEATRVAEAARAAEAARVAEAERVAQAERSAEEAANGCKGGVCESVGNCFAAGTPVLTPDGEKPIEQVAVGDVVLARDPVTGETRTEHVVELFFTPQRAVVDLELTADGANVSEHLTVTAEHPFYAEGRGFVPVKDLDIGTHVETAGGMATVTSLTSLPTKITVYNFEVEDAHTYFVGHLAAWVHNVCAAQFEKAFSEISSPGERVAVARKAVADYAESQGWKKDSRLSRINNRDVYRDPKTDKLYSTDTRHGRIEVLDRRGVHQGEIDIDGNPTKPAQDHHDLRMG